MSKLEGGEWVKIGQTESIANQSNLEFVKKISIDKNLNENATFMINVCLDDSESTIVGSV